jgi:hypothetical protein
MSRLAARQASSAVSREMTCSRMPNRRRRLAAGDDVQQQPAPGLALERGRHLGRQGGRDLTGAEGDEELQPLGHLGEHRGGEPGVLAPHAGRGERGLEAQLLGAARYLPEIGDRRRPDGARDGGGRPVTAADDVAPVAARRQEPVETQGRHGYPYYFDRNTIH